MADGLASFGGPVRILIAERDRTGQAFLGAWHVADARIERCPGADHAYSDPGSHAWLVEQLLSSLTHE